MDKYVTGAVIRKLREDKKMTQEELAGKLFVSSKAVSKWETGQGFPDAPDRSRQKDFYSEDS